MRALVVLGCLLVADSVFACRCAPRDLAECFASADEVFMATLLRTEPFGEDQRRFHFQLIGEPYKALPNASPTRPYVSSASSAGCGVEAEPGAVYVVFAEHDSESGVAWLTTCNGTRIHRARDGSIFGFDDVPPRFVISQLDAHAAIDALRGLASPIG